MTLSISKSLSHELPFLLTKMYDAIFEAFYPAFRHSSLTTASGTNVRYAPFLYTSPLIAIGLLLDGYCSFIQLKFVSHTSVILHFILCFLICFEI